MSSLAGSSLFLARMLFVSIAFCLLVEGFGRIGTGALRVWRRKRSGALDGVGIGALLGLSIFGFACLGLALAGLFAPLAIVGAFVGMVVVARVPWRHSFVITSAREFGAVGRLGIAFTVVALAPVAWYLLLPESHPDCWAYHLGVPWQYLMAGRAIHDFVQPGFHFSLPFEMAFALPLSLGDDRLA